MSEPTEVYVVTPQQLLVAYLALVAVTLLAVAVAVCVLREDRTGQGDGQQTPPPPRRPRDRIRRTGTIHAPRYQNAADEDTVVIERAGERR